MIYCKQLDKEFVDKPTMLKYIKDNKSTILAQKKAEIKTKTNNSLLGFMDITDNVVKEVPNMDNDYIYPVISNTNFLDSHNDVHLNGSMSKTAQEQNKKVYYVADHTLKVDSVIAEPKDVEIELKTLKWSDLGRNYGGTTEAMIFKIKKDNIIHDKFKRMIEKGTPLQNSIRMQYIKIDMAMNTDDKDFAEEKAVYDEIYPLIANKEALEDNDYLIFAVRELKIHLEGSAVLFGSNSATPINKEAVNDTSNNEPSNDTQKEQLKEFLNKIKI